MAVFTELSSEEISALLTGYDLGDLKTHKGMLKGVENTNYFIETTKGHFILTLFEGRARPTDLPYFMAIMQHLHDRGFSSPKPIENNKGEILQHVKGKMASIVSFLEGVEPTTITPNHLTALGTKMAEMHETLGSFKDKRTNDFSLPTWQSMATEVAPHLDNITDDCAKRVAMEIKYLSKVWPNLASGDLTTSELPTGTIHADLFPDNVFFEGDTFTGFIDFYFTCTDFLIYDLAVAINSWCFDKNHQFQPHFAAALIKGYEQVRPLTNAEVTALPIMYRGAALRFLLTRAYDKYIDLPKPENYVINEPIGFARRLQFFQEWKQGQRPID